MKKIFFLFQKGQIVYSGKQRLKEKLAEIVDDILIQGDRRPGWEVTRNKNWKVKNFYPRKMEKVLCTLAFIISVKSKSDWLSLWEDKIRTYHQTYENYNVI